MACTTNNRIAANIDTTGECNEAGPEPYMRRRGGRTYRHFDGHELIAVILNGG